MTMQEEESFYNALMGEEPCVDESKLTLEDIEESIGECTAMLQYSIDTTNKAEISFWRRMLQKAKKQRLEILTA